MALGTKNKAMRSKKAVILPSRKAHSYISSHRTYHLAKDTILTIIALVMMMMIGLTFFCLIATPEFLVKREIESIAKDYYENYFYTTTLNNNSLEINEHSDNKNSTLDKIFSRYEKTGFSRTTLRQLLLFDDQKHITSMASLAKYCDLDKTQIKIYPEPPFDRQNYRIDYTYSCKF